MILANLPPITDTEGDPKPNNLAGYSGHACKRMAVLGVLLLNAEGGTMSSPSHSPTADQTNQQQAQRDTSNIPGGEFAYSLGLGPSAGPEDQSTNELVLGNKKHTKLQAKF